MDRRAWRPTAHGIAKSQTAEQIKLHFVVNLQCCVSFKCSAKKYRQIDIFFFGFISITGYSVQFSSVAQSLSDSAIPCTAACQASLSITKPWSLLRLMSIESVMPSNHLILCRPLLLLPSIFPSIRVFSSESALHITWPQYWSFSFSTSPSNEYSELVSFRMDWLDLLAVQGDSQESSTTQEFKSIDSSTFSFLNSRTSYINT